ncbi:MmpS family transport accessory protein [Mycobacterium sp. BMJ-28]
MTNSPRGDEPTQRLDGRSGDAHSGYPGYSGYPDPAYAGQAPYGPRPTEPIPAYPAYDPAYATNQYGAPYGSPPQQPPVPGEPAPPEGPRTPRWLWVVAAIAIIVVLGLVIALVIVNSSQQDTVVAPVPSLSEPTTTSAPTTTRRSTSTPTPSAAPSPSPTTPVTPGVPSAEPGVTQSVVYTVSGTGRAINITYVDTGGVLQTEFNVMLPWSKTVDLSKPAKGSASVSIINVGRQVSCSISIDGASVQQRSGSGLTICSPIG